MPSEIPDRLYFKIGDVAKIAEVATHVLRYWETEFPAIKPKRANSKQRLYRREDVELILRVKHLLHEKGFTIAGAKKLLEQDQKKGQETQPKPKVKTGTKTAHRLHVIKKELLELQRLLEQ